MLEVPWLLQIMHDACISIEWKGPIVVGPVKESFPIPLEVNEEGKGESILIAPFDGFRAHINRSPLRFERSFGEKVWPTMAIQSTKGCKGKTIDQSIVLTNRKLWWTSSLNLTPSVYRGCSPRRFSPHFSIPSLDGRPLCMRHVHDDVGRADWSWTKR